MLEYNILDYNIADSFADNKKREIIGPLPDRWGRMDELSRATIFETGRILRENGLIACGEKSVDSKLIIGLICGSRRGSLAADLAYSYTMKDNAGYASPALFSYTLPNIPLAEAANHYNLTGPVFILLSQKPYQEAIKTAENYLICSHHIYGILTGQIDCIPAADGGLLTVNLLFLTRNDKTF